jgi:hypothetical protein
MTSPSPLERLAGPGNVLGKEAPDAKEFDGLVRSGFARLKDAENETNSLESRFDLAYGAAHALCLAALRHHGFRPSKRYIVFQLLPDTLGLGPEVWRVLSKCHDMRNRTEYEGALDVDERLVTDLIAACRQVADKIRRLPAIPQRSK